jgi:hypothetical protein
MLLQPLNPQLEPNNYYKNLAVQYCHNTFGYSQCDSMHIGVISEKWNDIDVVIRRSFCCVCDLFSIFHTWLLYQFQLNLVDPICTVILHFKCFPLSTVISGYTDPALKIHLSSCRSLSFSICNHLLIYLWHQCTVVFATQYVFPPPPKYFLFLCMLLYRVLLCFFFRFSFYVCVSLCLSSIS